nr:RHS repeat-associated core domain-containing protein [Streptomyces africanus]
MRRTARSTPAWTASGCSPTHPTKPCRSSPAGSGRPVRDARLLLAAGGDSGLCPLAFPGQYRDAETGLHYNLARYYDPDTASYPSPDPLGLVPAPNHHAYVGNPLRWSDPLGLEGDEPIRIYDDSTFDKHGSSSSSSAKGEIGRAPTDGQAALDRSITRGDGSNPDDFRRIGPRTRRALSRRAT